LLVKNVSYLPNDPDGRYIYRVFDIHVYANYAMDIDSYWLYEVVNTEADLPDFSPPFDMSRTGSSYWYSFYHIIDTGRAVGYLDQDLANQLKA
jgi:hypothetical protein